VAKDREVTLENGVPTYRTTSDNIEDFNNASGQVAVNDAVYLSSDDTVSKAINTDTTQEVIGLVFETPTATTCRVLTWGIIFDFDTGMTVNDRYYLGGTAGELTTTKPTGGGTFAQVVGIAVNGTDLLVVPQVGITEIDTSVTLDDAYDNGHTVAVDDGAMLLNLTYDASPSAGEGFTGIEINVGTAAGDLSNKSTGFEYTLGAGAYTAEQRGILVDFSTATSLTDAGGNPSYGIELLGESQTSGDSVGLYVDAGWDYGIRLVEDQYIQFGSDATDFGTIRWIDAAGCVAFELDDNANDAFHFIGPIGMLGDTSGTPYGLTTSGSDTGFSMSVMADQDASSIALAGIVVDWRGDNASNVPATGSNGPSYEALKIRVYADAGDTDATANYFGARIICEDDSGSAVKTGLRVESGGGGDAWDRGIEIDQDFAGGTAFALSMGDDNDLKFYHDGTDSKIDNGTGDLVLDNQATGFIHLQSGNDTTTTGTKILNNSGTELAFFRSDANHIYNSSGRFNDDFYLYFGTDTDWQFQYADTGNAFTIANPNTPANNVVGSPFTVTGQVGAAGGSGNAGTVGTTFSWTAGTGGAASTAGGETAGVGGDYFSFGGTGGAASTAFAGATGGEAQFAGGSGGAGSAAQAAGSGGRFKAYGGAAGADGGGGGGTGGAVEIDGGTGVTGGTVQINGGLGGTTDGDVQIGQSNTNDITLGASNATITQTGTGQVTFAGNVDADAGLDVEGNFTHATSGTGDIDRAWDFSGGLTNSAGELLVSGGNVQLDDDILLSFGTSDDVTMEWNGSALEVLPAVDDSSWRWGNGTNSFVMFWFGNSASDTMTWDAATNSLTLSDNVDLHIGNSQDLTLVHNTTNSVVTSTTGDLIIDNTNTSGQTIARLGTDTNATDFEVQNNSGIALMTVDGAGAVTIPGDLTVNGTMTTVSSESLNITNSHITLNSDYNTASDIDGCLVVIVAGEGTTDTVAATGFESQATTGGDAKIHTTGAATFSAGDLLQVAGANTDANDGIYEVSAHASNELTVKASPHVSAGFVSTDFTDDTDTSGTLSKIVVNILKSNTDGTWEISGEVDATPITYSTLATATGALTLDDAYTNGRTITQDLGPIVINGDATTTGGALDINPDVLAETSYQVDVSWAAGNYTGTLGGLNVDYSTATSLSNASDIVGVRLDGITNGGGGESVGLDILGTWDIGIRVADGIPVNLGSGTWVATPASTGITWAGSAGSSATGTIWSATAGAGDTGFNGGSFSWTAGAGGVADVSNEGGEGGQLSLTSGDGGDATTSNNAGPGGAVGLTGGAGGTGASGVAAGDGGSILFTAGDGGAANGGTAGAGGGIRMDAGDGLTAGNINLGINKAATINLGNTADATNVDLPDDVTLRFGDGADAQLKWDGAQLEVVPATDHADWAWGSSGGSASWSIIWYGTSASNYFFWDSTGDRLQFDNASIAIDDDQTVGFGNITNPDVAIEWDTSGGGGNEIWLFDRLGAGNSTTVFRMGADTTGQSFIVQNGSAADIMRIYGDSSADFTVADNLATAFRIWDGTDEYLKVTTTNDSEVIALGNTSTNPDLTQLGTGQVTFAGNVDANAGVDLPDDIELVFGSDSDITIDYNSTLNAFLVSGANATGQSGGVGIAGARFDFFGGNGADAVANTNTGGAGANFRAFPGDGGSAAEGTSGQERDAGDGGIFTFTAGVGGSGSGATDAANAAGDGGGGGTINITGGKGGTASEASGSGTDHGAAGGGGNVSILAGQGGNGTASEVSGDGGTLTLRGGAAGTDNGGGAGTAGTVSIGDSNTATLNLGNSTDQTNIDIPDNVTMRFGTGNDAQLRWDGTDMDVLAAADDQVWKWGDGTNSWDMWWYGNTASNTVVLDASADTWTFDAVDLHIGDDDNLVFGDGADVAMYWDGQMRFIPAVDGTNLWWGNGTESFDIFWLGSSGGNSMAFNSAADQFSLAAIDFFVDGGDADFNMVDNTNSAFQVREDTNAYIDIDTTDSSELITIGNSTTNPDTTFAGTGTVTWEGNPNTNTVEWRSASNFMLFNGADLQFGDDDELRFGDNSEIQIQYTTSDTFLIQPVNDNTLLYLGGTGGSASFDVIWTGSTSGNDIRMNSNTDVMTLDGIDLTVTGALNTTGTVDIDLTDNTAQALLIAEGIRAYIDVGTTDAGESVTFGNATTNPVYSFVGSGTTTFGGDVEFQADITIDDNTASVFTIIEGSNNYLNITTTNSNEIIQFGNATTNPDFSFLGTGTADFQGPLTIDGTIRLTNESDPTNVSGNGFVYVKDVATISELYYLDDTGTATQITTNGAVTLTEYISVRRTAVATTSPDTEFNPLGTTTPGGTMATDADSGDITFTSTTGVFTIPSTGAYEFIVTLYLTQSGGGVLDSFFLEKNGTTTIWTGNALIHQSVDPSCRSFSVIVDLAASDTVEVRVDSSGSTTLTAELGCSCTIKRIS